MFKGNSTVEEFLLEDCFLEELLKLNKGFPFNIGGTEYFLQVRLISHILDLAALCPILRLQAFQSSKAGCKLCNVGGGTTIFYSKDDKSSNDKPLNSKDDKSSNEKPLNSKDDKSSNDKSKSLPEEKKTKKKKDFVVKYIDSRHPLPIKHYLKSSGLSRNCCPKCDDSVLNDYSKISVFDVPLINFQGYKKMKFIPFIYIFALLKKDLSLKEKMHS